MKKKIGIAVIVALMISSCSDWLDVTPENTIVENDLFKESTGFQNALNGVYDQLASTELYGRELTYGLIDAMGQVYCLQGENYSNIKSYDYYYQAAKFQYDANNNIKDAFNAMWTTAYNTIANCNNIIKNVGQLATADFREGEAERALIRGEALAVRAMLHFDLLRVFAPAPVMKDEKLYIPYVTDFPYYGGLVPLSVEETMKNIEKDLIEAKDLIMPFDTLDESHRALLSNYYRFAVPSTSSLGDDGSEVQMLPFYQYRGYRMNALAVTAILARFYNYWGGNKQELAARYAREVIGFVGNKSYGTPALEYTGTHAARYDRKFTKDLIFCLSYPMLQEDYETYARSTSNSCLTISKFKDLWENYDLADKGDLRYKLINNDGWDFFPLKNIRLDGTNDMITATEDMVPMIRLSEMHFVLAEYYASIGDFVQAAAYINEVRVGRNCAGDVDLGISDLPSFKARLLSEVRREYFSEGQTFFYYKKYGEGFSPAMAPESFVVPKPESENVN